MGDGSNLPSLSDVRSLAQSAPDEYWSPRTQALERDLISLEQDGWNIGCGIVERIEAATGGSNSELVASFDALPETVHAAVQEELMRESPLMPDMPSWEHLQMFAQSGAGAVLCSEWGHDKEIRLAKAEARVERLVDSLDPVDTDALLAWFRGLSPGQQTVIVRELAR
jgi:hypothetical protein